MDTNLMAVYVTVALAVVVVAGFFFFRRHKNVGASITGPSGMSATFKASGGQPEPRAGIRQVDIEGRNVTATDHTGDGVEQRQIRATGDVVASASTSGVIASKKV